MYELCLHMSPIPYSTLACILHLTAPFLYLTLYYLYTTSTLPYLSPTLL